MEHSTEDICRDVTQILRLLLEYPAELPTLYRSGSDVSAARAKSSSSPAANGSPDTSLQLPAQNMHQQLLSALQTSLGPSTFVYAESQAAAHSPPTGIDSVMPEKQSSQLLQLHNNYYQCQQPEQSTTIATLGYTAEPRGDFWRSAAVSNNSRRGCVRVVLLAAHADQPAAEESEEHQSFSIPAETHGKGPTTGNSLEAVQLDVVSEAFQHRSSAAAHVSALNIPGDAMQGSGPSCNIESDNYHENERSLNGVGVSLGAKKSAGSKVMYSNRSRTNKSLSKVQAKTEPSAQAGDYFLDPASAELGLPPHASQPQKMAVVL